MSLKEKVDNYFKTTNRKRRKHYFIKRIYKEYENYNNR